MKRLSLQWVFRACLLSLFLLAGCAQQRIRDEASSRLRGGEFETAIQGLQDGVRQYPESALLRAGLVSARNEAMARLVAQAAQLRAQSKFDEAEKAVLRALALDPENSRLRDLQTDLTLARRQRERLDEVSALLAAGKKEQAFRMVEAALRDAPRQPELLALQRRLASELRLDQAMTSTRLLAEGRPISLDFRGAPLSTVLEAVTRGSGINFIIDRDVRQDGRVTVFLRSARVEDAIDLIAAANQLARRIIDPQTVLIYPNTPEKHREHQEQVIRVFHLANTDAKTASALLRSIARIKEPFIDERANLIVIRETPELVAVAERLLNLLDMGDAEVMLEIEILEIKTTRLTELGINFPNSFSLTPLPLAGATGLTVSSLRSLNSHRIGVSVSELLVNLRREVGDFNILANPRIRAKNREKAQILIGDKVPVITSTSTATGFVAESVSYLDVGLRLDVEAVVAPDDEVTIKLSLEVSSLVKEVRTATGSLAYQVGTRNAKTTLRLRDGETQLLAGLISNEDRSTSNRLPGLGDLPILGRLFSSQRDDAQRTELVLAITPRILRSAPRPDLAQAQMWVGTELVTRLRAAPVWPAINVTDSTAVAKDASEIVAAPSITSPMSAIATARQGLPDNVPPKGQVRTSWQGPSEVRVGETFTVNLLLASGQPLRGAPLEIAFPSDMIEIVEAHEGDYFKQGNGVTSFTQAVNVSTGRLGAAILRSSGDGATGQANLLSLRLKAKAVGAAQLRLASFQPITLGEPVAGTELPVLTITVK